jgi:tetratricopeptide (TPR) repeat protein
MSSFRVPRVRVLFALAPALVLAFGVPRPLLAETPQELVRQGDALFASARYREALSAFEKARTQDPGNIDILRRVARSRWATWEPVFEDPSNRKVLETATGEYKELLARDPDDQEALDRLVRGWIDLRRSDEAYVFLKDRNARRPEEPQTIVFLVRLCEIRGNPQERLSWLHRLVALAPNDPAPHYALGTSAWEQSYNSPGDKLEAGLRRKVLADGQAELDRAIALEPEYFEAMLYKNLLFREEAKIEPDASKKAALIQKGDEWQKKAFEVRKRARTRPPNPLEPPPPPPPPPRKTVK